jgi:hypothetical protein
VILTKRSTLDNPPPALTTTTYLQWSQHPSGTARQPPSSLPESQHHCHLACCLLLPRHQHHTKATTASEASNMSDDDNNFSLPPPSHHGQAQLLLTVQQQGKYHPHAKTQGQSLPLPAFHASPALTTTNRHCQTSTARVMHAGTWRWTSSTPSIDSSSTSSWLFAPPRGQDSRWRQAGGDHFTQARPAANWHTHNTAQHRKASRS